MNFWDEMHSTAISNVASIKSSWPIYEKENIRLRVGGEAKHCSLPIDAYLVPGEPNNKRLIVAFHGAIMRKSIQIPRFEWMGQLTNRKEHKLFIADTTLELSDDLNLAWYIGTPKFDLTVKLRKFIEHVRNINNFDEIVLMGSSGGGFAALSIGSQMKKCCSLAYSPQTNIWDFTPGHSEMFIKSTFDGRDENITKDSIRFRTDLVEQYMDGRHTNKYIYYQNTGDTDHVNKHWRRFAKSQGVQLKNGRSFNQNGLFISDFDGDGHVRPPVEKNDKLIDQAFQLASGRDVLLLEDEIIDANVENIDFNMGEWDLELVPTDWLMYAAKAKHQIPPESATIGYTDNKVPLRIFDGVAFDHPVLQAQTGLKLLNNILLDKSGSEASDLVHDIIIHLLDYAVKQEDALYFPFKFSWHQERLQPPWYSAMAQGQVLQLMCRYAELTGDNTFDSEIEKVFNSFRRVCKRSDVISVVHVDENMYLWLEEYPYPSFNKFVLNGHIFAALGVYEYWRYNGNPLAKKLFLGACDTVRNYIGDFRNAGWSSNYDLRSKLLIRNYHQTHIMQLESLYRVLGDTFFTSVATTFEKDFPHFQTATSVYFRAGSHIGYKTDNTRLPTKILESKDFLLDKAVAYKSPVRTKIETEEGVWLLIEDSGPLDGYWFREESKSVFPRLCIDRRLYPRSRLLIPKSDAIKINSFNEWGSPIEVKTINIDKGAPLKVSSTALWNGDFYCLIEDTEIKGWHLVVERESTLL